MKRSLEDGNSEWILEQWVKRHGANRAVEHLPCNEIVDLSEFDVVKAVPVDLLPFILGYTALSDTLSVMLVCRAWYAATQKHHFWSRRIQRKKEETISRLASGEEHFGDFILRFNTFFHPEESLRQQVEWLFRDDWLYVDDDSSWTIDVFRLTHVKGYRTKLFYTRQR